MKLKSLAAAAVLAVASLGAAADQTSTFAGGLASFLNEPIALGSFSQVINFDGLASGWYSVDGVMSATNVTWSSVTLNGNLWSIGSFGKFSFGSIEVTSSTPLSMTLIGSRPSAATSSYSGTLTVSAVPEPESYALMLAGLGLIGTIALRRSKASQST